MHIELRSDHRDRQAAFRSFVDREIVPEANQYDQDELVPAALLAKLAETGYLGALIPTAHNGLGLDAISFGLLNEELGRGCSSVRSLLTVHSMVSHTILRWGTPQQRAHWLPRLARGTTIGAFGLSEPDAGSDAKSITTTATRQGDSFVLNGHKKWTTFGQIAGLFLIFAQCDGKLAAFLVERERPGFSTTPISGMLGTRASMLAELHLDQCEIPRANQIGGIGFGLAAVATSALDIGRYSVAWGSVGIGQACLEASLAYTSQRKQFGTYLKDHQLIQQMVTNMLTNVKAARLLCHQAGQLKDKNDPSSVMETWIAKYFASTTAMKAASDAVQIHGANGCSPAYPVQRYFRDAKIMEIIEGSTQLQQITIAEYGYASHDH